MRQEIKRLTRKWVSQRLPKRPKTANKGTFGKVLVIAGSENFPGAAYLSCAAAYRVGAGLVTLTTTPNVKIIVSRQLPELTFISYDEISKRVPEADALLIGPGLGQMRAVSKLIEKLLNKKLPKLVIDGDGLNILSYINKWWDIIKTKMVLTPHPGEMSRLAGLTIEQVQSDRSKIAKQFAKLWNQTVVLKGANTVVVSPAGEIAISPFANPLLATAGTGDVLSGIIAGMMAQGLTNFNAACVGVYLHGLAGQILRKKFGDRGLLASDLLVILPKAIQHTQTLNQ